MTIFFLTLEKKRFLRLIFLMQLQVREVDATQTIAIEFGEFFFSTLEKKIERGQFCSMVAGWRS